MWLSDFHLYNPRVQYYKLLFIVLLHTQKKISKISKCFACPCAQLANSVDWGPKIRNILFGK